jgi:hypothetical protein
MDHLRLQGIIHPEGNIMSEPSQLEAIRIARSVANIAKANDIIQHTGQSRSVANLMIVAAANGILGVLLVYSGTPYTNSILGAFTLIGISLAYIAIGESRRLHKRLNAALVLLSAKDEG